MEQDNSKLNPEKISSFYRTELRVLRSACASEEEFILRVASLLDSKDGELEDLRIELSSKIYLLNKLDIDHE